MISRFTIGAEVTGRYRRDDRPLDGEIETPLHRPQARRRRGGKLPALGGFLLLAVGLVLGASQQYSRQQEVAATARQEHDFVPRVQVATVEASCATVSVTLPGTTAAFAAANTSRELLDRLQAQCRGVYTEGQLPTLRRRLKDWRREAAHRMVFGTMAVDPGDAPGDGEGRLLGNRANAHFSDREGGAKSPVDLPLRLDDAKRRPNSTGPTSVSIDL